MHCWPTWPCFSLLDLTTLTLPPCNDPLMVEQTNELLNSQKGFLILCLKSLHFGNFCYFFTLGAHSCLVMDPSNLIAARNMNPRGNKKLKEINKRRGMISFTLKFAWFAIFLPF